VTGRQLIDGPRATVARARPSAPRSGRRPLGRTGRPVETALLPGERGARLFAGPPAAAGAEPLAEHETRLGPLRPPPSPSAAEEEHCLELVKEAGLLGRGGGEFPLWWKLETARQASLSSGMAPIVVVNGAEGEPASRKDRTLLELRPHLVLDGAAFEAACVGASEVVVYLEPDRLASVAAVVRALEERRRAGAPDPVFRLEDAGGSYVSGETSAVVSALETGRPLPHRRPKPAAVSGVSGRPTVVSNAETAAQAALAARFGAGWFRRAGSESCPGSSLVTLAGAVAVPGLALEIVAPTPGAELLERFGGLDLASGLPKAVLVGGYAGRMVSGETFCTSHVDRGLLRQAGVPLGCGLLAVLPDTCCGLAVTCRLLTYLAAQSAGQCGPCVFGLPALVDDLRALVDGEGGRRTLRRLARRAVSIAGHGACGHPDGAVGLLESALALFEDDVRAHLRGRGCDGDASAGWLPATPPR